MVVRDGPHVVRRFSTLSEEAIIIQTVEGCYKEVGSKEDRNRMKFRPAEAYSQFGEETLARVQQQVELAKINSLMDEISGLSVEIEALEAGVRYFDMFYGDAGEKSEPVRLSSHCSSVATTAESPRMPDGAPSALVEACSVDSTTAPCSNVSSARASPWEVAVSPTGSSISTPRAWDVPVSPVSRAFSTSELSSTTCPPSPALSTVTEPPRGSDDQDITIPIILTQANCLPRASTLRSSESCSPTPTLSSRTSDSGSASEKSEHDAAAMDSTPSEQKGTSSVSDATPSASSPTGQSFRSAFQAAWSAGWYAASTGPKTGAWPCSRRQVNALNGKAQTVTVDEYGRTKVFDQEIVSAFLNGAFEAAKVVFVDEKGNAQVCGEQSINGGSVMKKWISSLSVWHLKGFEQELRFRVSDIWKEYDSYNTQLENYLEHNDYTFFGLDKTATVSDLDKAFRRLAKLLHPDKNGDSEEAKLKFQDLKDRHEALRRKIQDPPGQETNQRQPKILDEGQDFDADAKSEEEREEDRAEVDEDDEEDTLNRDYHEKKIWDLLQAAKVMEQQIKAIKSKLQSGGVLGRGANS